MKNSKSKIKPIPDFISEEKEREFWDNADTTEYFDMNGLTKVRFSKFKIFNGIYFFTTSNFLVG